MLCDECKKNEATFHAIKKINGVSTEKHLCAECQAKQSAKGQGIVDFTDMFSGFKSLFEPPRRSAVLRCSKCGTTSEEFLNTAYVGCPDCYTELKAVINPVIQKTQNASIHTGKSVVPITKEDKDKEYARLQAMLEEAINRDDMKTAEEVFGRIRKLKGNAE